jgi:hypothetical protein
VQEKLKETGFKDLPPGLLDSLNSAFSKGINSVQALEKELAGQFDAAMERASGWYKRATQGILIVGPLRLRCASTSTPSTSPSDFFRTRRCSPAWWRGAPGQPGDGSQPG